jgi:hypothetical protein
MKSVTPRSLRMPGDRFGRKRMPLGAPRVALPARRAAGPDRTPATRITAGPGRIGGMTSSLPTGLRARKKAYDPLMVAALRAQPAEVPPLEAVRRSVRKLFGGLSRISGTSTGPWRCCRTGSR